jgi:hypothetical protein
MSQATRRPNRQRSNGQRRPASSEAAATSFETPPQTSSTVVTPKAHIMVPPGIARPQRAAVEPSRTARDGNRNKSEWSKRGVSFVAGAAVAAAAIMIGGQTSSAESRPVEPGSTASATPVSEAIISKVDVIDGIPYGAYSKLFAAGSGVRRVGEKCSDDRTVSECTIKLSDGTTVKISGSTDMSKQPAPNLPAERSETIPCALGRRSCAFEYNPYEASIVTTNNDSSDGWVAFDIEWSQRQARVDEEIILDSVRNFATVVAATALDPYNG